MGVTVPDGWLQPFALATSDDHTAWIAIAVVLGLAYSLLFIALRITIRLSTRQRSSHDDYIMGVATVRLQMATMARSS
jgi:hypothetical protein